MSRESKLIRRLLIEEVMRLQDAVEQTNRERLRLLDEIESKTEYIGILQGDLRNLEYDLASYRAAAGDFDSVVKRIYDEDPGYYSVNKIPFVKEVRQRLNLGLKEAKDLVDKFFAKPLNEAEDAS